MRLATCSWPRAMRTSRSARSRTGSSTAPPPSTATFPSKDDIFFALAEQGFRLLFESGELADDDPGPDGLDAVRRPFLHLYEFSQPHPEYFALMFVDRSVPRISAELGALRVRRYDQRTAHRPDPEGGGCRPFPRRNRPARRVPHSERGGRWAPSVMRLCNRLGARRGPGALARDTLEAALTGLRSGFRLTFHPGGCDRSDRQ